MMANSQDAIQQLYRKYYIDRDNEQVDLFRLLKKSYNISKTVYPGSYVHVSPSFIFPQVVYIDSDKKAIKFFQSQSHLEMVNQRKEYTQSPMINFYGMDYREFLEEYRSFFDLLISQFAGFISDICKPYLRIGGYLLVNNSHADAGLASIDEDYTLISTIHKVDGRYRLSDTSLDDYFKPKKEMLVTEELLKERKKGIGYTKTATFYLFQKVN